MTSVEYTEEFEAWWHALTEREQNDVSHVVDMLAEQGSRLPFPYSSAVGQSRHGHMRELRVQSGGVRSVSSTLSIRAARPSC